MSMITVLYLFGLRALPKYQRMYIIQLYQNFITTVRCQNYFNCAVSGGYNPRIFIDYWLYVLVL